jgi:hypothetical protein
MQPSLSSVAVAPTVFMVGGALLLNGCASTPKAVTTAKAADERKVVLSEAEYEYVYITGSNIPVRVPKTPIARPLLTSSPVRVISPEDFEKWVQRGQMGGRP